MDHLVDLSRVASPSSLLPRTPRLVDCLLAFSVFFSVAISVSNGNPLRVAVAAVPLVVGILLLLERPVRCSGSFGQAMACLPAITLAGPVLAFAAPWSDWTHFNTALLGSGVVITVVSLSTLGRSFGIFPAARRVVHSGPYRWVRHPAYLGQLLILTACGLSVSPQMGGLTMLVATACLGLRIRAEEQVLTEQWASYREYTQQVPWKLMPFIW